MPRLLLLLAVVSAAILPVAAQGALSTQGFGYPAGELSTRAAGTGGATAESDPQSPVNPAALANWGPSGLYLQYTPEFRSVSANGTTDRTTTARFPLFMGALNVGARGMVSISATTLLDRTWQTSRKGFDHFGSDSVSFSEAFSAGGAINDVRLAGSYQLSRSLAVGIGGHVLTGQNQLRIVRTFGDTTFAPFTESSTLAYSGTALSAGVLWIPVASLTVGASGRVGGTLKSFRNDSTLTHAQVPNTFGGSAAFTGIPGLLLAARADRTSWSRMNGLASSTIRAVDGWDWSVGLEARGPGFFGADVVPLRFGYRHRTLPFQVNDATVTETAYSGGLGIPLVRGRSRLDLTATRAIRSADVGATEHAWILSFGFLVRP